MSSFPPSTLNGSATGSYPHGGNHDIIAGATGIYTQPSPAGHFTGLGLLEVAQLYSNLK